MTCRTRAARTIASVVLLSIAGLASAQEVRTGPQWWGNVNPASYHLGDEDEFLAPGEDFNQETLRRVRRAPVEAAPRGRYWLLTQLPR